MERIVAMMLALALVAGCGGGGGGGSNPLQPDEEEDVVEDEAEAPVEDDEGGIDSDRTLPPGTASPTPSNDITRLEARNDDGGGFARDINYDSDTDTFSVDNIAFDGDNTYDRGTAVSSLGPFAVYEADLSSTDPDTGAVVNNLDYRAIYGVSDSGNTEFAIVRTGDYVDYGFGGYVYQRTGGVTLPTEGVARYEGEYAGVRIFDGTTGLNYVRGDASMTVDFSDFDSAPGVQLFVFNRRLFDINGNDVTEAYVTALADDTTDLIRPRDASGNDALPVIRPTVTPNVADTNGEIVQDVFTLAGLTDGTTQPLSDGTYYAIMAGEGASEITGVLIMTGTDPRNDTSFQETGGFTVYRQ